MPDVPGKCIREQPQKWVRSGSHDAIDVAALGFYLSFPFPHDRRCECLVPFVEARGVVCVSPR